MAATKAQVIAAPSREDIRHSRVIFLAGTTTAPEWREALIAELSEEPLTIINPLRPDWDSSWREDETFQPFREQVEWELEMQEKANVVVIYFGPSTDAPISLFEFGFSVASRKALVVCHPAYGKKGNVQIICRRHNITMIASLDGVAQAVLDELRR